MDAERSIFVQRPGFWPKIGKRCKIVKETHKGVYCIIDILKDWPVNRYLIRSLTDGTLRRVFRHEVEPAVNAKDSTSEKGEF